MYGILIEGLHHYLTEKFGEEFWLTATENVMGARKVIQTQQVYSETLLPRLVTYIAEVTGLQEENVYFELGQSFISYLSKVGYASLLRITGSGFPEFLNELDDLHHHLQYTYPHLKPPAFVLVSQTDTTVDLMYTSKREHYAHYVRGQLTKVASVFYDLDVTVELIEHVKQLDSNRFTLRITNEKGRWPRVKHQQFSKDAPENTPTPTHISSEQFLDLFNFCILFSEDLKLQHVSNGFKRFHEVKLGRKLFDVFQLDRPKIDAVFTQVMFKKLF
ncbi:soluble guanylate cyclase gcy-33 [Clonorchis sinensis]|uniref:guanylate cyclase n=1 Tax=Clonorchis sinensis TaxID=79923 RepID=G7YSC7_CLOSI|nr:soluble guanylate cyclase gcy-33 [Clonorchis sinensis]